MKFQNVAIESIGFTLPTEIMTSAQLESQLQPVYERLRLPEGRLELMSGIRERRFFPPHTSIGAPSVNSAQLVLDAAQLDPQDVGCLIHASVCRDYLEPATACRVHAELGLGPNCWVHDLSNACLGLLSGMTQIATLIESGAITAGIVVGTENARSLVENTIAALNADMTLTRQSIKPSFASLTIGSGSCAILLKRLDKSRTGNRLVHCVARSESQHHALCQSDSDQAGSSMQPLMQTDSELLLQSGVAVGARTFEALLGAGLERDYFEKTVCHQVGVAHRNLMLERLGLPKENDYSTFHWLGNTGAVALPTALAMGLQCGFIQSGQQVGLFGIGSGINCIMMATEWTTPNVAGYLDDNARSHLARVEQVLHS